VKEHLNNTGHFKKRWKIEQERLE